MRVPSSGLNGWVVHDTIFVLAFGIVVDDQLERVQHREAAFGRFVEHLAHAVPEQNVVDQRVGFRDADAFGKQMEAFGHVAAAARTDQRRHARIVPAGDVLFLNQLDQLALGQNDVGQVET